LDLRVEAFGEGGGDGMLEVGQQMNQMGFEGAGDVHELGQAVPHTGVVSLFEEALHWRRLVGPKIGHLFFVQPSAGRLQVHLQQFAEAGLMPVRDRALQSEDRVFRRDWSPRAVGREDLLQAGPVPRLIEMLVDV
jgi:hypothetical protein